MKTLYFLEYGMGLTDKPLHIDHTTLLPVMGKPLWLLIRTHRVLYTVCGVIAIPDKHNEYIVYLSPCKI